MDDLKPGTLVKFFGKSYSYQGQFTDENALATAKANWTRIQHGVMIKKGGHLWVTQYKKPL